ncbi:sensor histidine kinase [Emticicia sp. BO119]|uniref:sensor histidine kinase n=1 Tax=Emticicia sp. BO119 TaxID=2757768 RepID=UPI0015F0C78D|nr:histidine kinase [Emticicia sp. BO119]MBA4853483.1 histidine kinase [Emticicia sp. BO119]
MFQLKNVSLITHLVGWLTVFSLTTLFLSENRSIAEVFLRPNLWFFFLIYMVLFYFNTLWLIPKFFFQKRYFIYFGIILCLLIGIAIIKPFDRLAIERKRENRVMQVNQRFPEFDRPPPPRGEVPPNFNEPRIEPPGGFQRGQRQEPPNKIDVISIFLFGLIWALGMALKISQRWQESEQRAIQAEADKAYAELSFLKAQINPHFLFNTLNNIYSLAVTNNKNTAASIMKLSQIMRYVTDEVAEDFVPLQSEIACISNYIDLQKLRLSKKTGVIFEVSGKTDSKQILPLLLMTFVENAFKHGISNHENSVIDIKIAVESNSIKFDCRNTLFATSKKVERTGIGLINTHKRLAHLYKNKYTLCSGEEAGFYHVELIIEA